MGFPLGLFWVLPENLLLIFTLPPCNSARAIISATASVGSISPTEMAMGLTGVSATGSVGSISPTEMMMGLTGVSATASVASMTTSSGGGIFAYADIDTGSNITYTDVTAP